MNLLEYKCEECQNVCKSNCELEGHKTVNHNEKVNENETTVIETLGI